VLASSSNELLTEGDIGDMGRRLASELDSFIATECRELGRLSFICHSLGGVITRSALGEPALAPYLSKLHAYVSLATPHCGYLLGDNNLLNTGIWFLKHWTKSACLSQLSVSDHTDPAECFLVKLAKAPALSHFAHVYFLAAHADKYAPFHSARVEIFPPAAAASADRKKATLFHAMVASLLGTLSSPSLDLRRFDLSFLPGRKSLDSFIGRTAHIQFLTETNYMKMIMRTHPQLFQ